MAGDGLNTEETGLQEARLWRERYRILFDGNVAGTVLTNVDGRIVDCNEPCARIFGFEFRDDMLAHSAWDFYFDRTEREAVIERLRSRGSRTAQEACLRNRNGLPVWVLTTCSVASFKEGQPDLLLGTAIDITAQKKARAKLGEIRDLESAARAPGSDSARTADLSHQLATLLRRASQALQPDNLPRMGRPEIQEFLLVLEEMKMLMSDLEVLRLFPK
ncbi:MAG: PAS domain-containing protein [Candidatus Sulfotelmatobacter sp.]